MTTIQNKILKHTYNDSIVLMQYSLELEMMPGIKKAAIMMGTPSVLQTLRESLLLVEDEKDISYDDIVIAVEAETKVDADAAIQAIEKKLLSNEAGKGSTDSHFGDLEENDVMLWREVPEDAKVALISVPGQYAAAEAWRALKKNRHVMLFSNNVSLEDEIALKKTAKDKGLLVMGPDCGTAIINGVPLGFANNVRRGDIGIVAAAGSGLQALTCQIDRLGYGISHAIGTGGRDLKGLVKGITTKMGLNLLEEDSNTKVIALLSKPPDPIIAEEILSLVRNLSKPVVVCLLGGKARESIDERVYFATTIDEMAEKAVNLSRGIPVKEKEYKQKIGTTPTNLTKSLRGFYSGGTLAYEAYLILQKELGEVYSNIPLNSEYLCELNDLQKNQHIVLDLGTEEFTTGRPHPMIDGRWRADLINRTDQNPDVGVILFDLILGLGADPDPASSISESISNAVRTAKKAGRTLTFIAAIIGTDKDPQNFEKQKRILDDAGVLIAETNAKAALLAVRTLKDLSTLKEKHEN